MTTKFKKTDLVEAIESFAHDVFVVNPGQKFLGDHPAVVAAPMYFVPADATEEDRAKARAAIVADGWLRAQAPQGAPVSPPAPKRALRAAECVIATRVVSLGVGTTLANGEPTGALPGDIVGAGTKLARKFPDAFEPVVTIPGLRRGEALVALSDISMTRADGTARRVLRGQWVRADDELVGMHPHQWALPPIQD